LSAVLGRAHTFTNTCETRTVMLRFYKNQERMSAHPYNLQLYNPRTNNFPLKPSSISAVCRGATLWGLEQSHATSFLSRIARTSYGIVYKQPWDSTNPNHQPSDKLWDSSRSSWMAHGQMTWLLKRVRGHTNSICLQELTLELSFSLGGRSCRRACAQRIHTLQPRNKPQQPQ